MAVTGRALRRSRPGTPRARNSRAPYRRFGTHRATPPWPSATTGRSARWSWPTRRAAAPSTTRTPGWPPPSRTRPGLALALTEARAAEDRLAVYADRERIARDLHDLTIQRIFAAGLSLQTLSRRLSTPGPDLPAAAGRLDGVIDELDAAIAEIRTTIFDLQLTADQEATSTRARVLREASRAARVLGFEPSVRFTGPLDSLVGGDTGAHLVAAVRETLANAAKHAALTGSRWW